MLSVRHCTHRSMLLDLLLEKSRFRTHCGAHVGGSRLRATIHPRTISRRFQLLITFVNARFFYSSIHLECISNKRSSLNICFDERTAGRQDFISFHFDVRAWILSAVIAREGQPIETTKLVYVVSIHAHACVCIHILMLTGANCFPCSSISMNTTVRNALY